MCRSGCIATCSWQTLALKDGDPGSRCGLKADASKKSANLLTFRRFWALESRLQYHLAAFWWNIRDPGAPHEFYRPGASSDGSSQLEQRHGGSSKWFGLLPGGQGCSGRSQVSLRHKHKLKAYIAAMRSAIPLFVENLNQFTKSTLQQLERQGGTLPDIPSEPFPDRVCFVDFGLEMCFSPQRHALARRPNVQKGSANGGLCAF